MDVKLSAQKGSGVMAGASPTLRSDARRNADRIRAAAVDVFREQGFSAPLDEIAATAQVSRATIFNRFGGRVGLIDNVIDDVIAAKLTGVIDDSRSISGIRDRIGGYVEALRDLQYRFPAVNDVLLQEFPSSEPLMSLCHAGSAFHDELVAEGHANRILAAEFTPGDFQALALESAVVLKHHARPPRIDYDRRTAFILGGIFR